MMATLRRSLRMAVLGVENGPAGEGEAVVVFGSSAVP
jgi:hypothetical protein